MAENNVAAASAIAPPQNGLIPYERAKADYVYVPMSDMAYMEEPSRLAEGNGKYLYATGMATCTGIAISGIYPPRSATDDAAIERYDRFMIHTDEDSWEQNFANLRDQVQEAKAASLGDLQIHVTAVHPDTLLGDYKQEDVDDSYKAQRELMTKLRELVGSNVESDDQPRIHWYPYRGDGEDFNTSMALYSDRSVLVNQDSFRRFTWGLAEKQWMNMAVSPVPMPTPPPDDWVVA
ncbi:hypothetical protein PG993_010905 [Apiospora rasikravindrae]|uniref:Uncharacterized protein n=1 Tax=Apiospora rasikravindrae TaxID=990691 RepID=A0ABR1SCQ4_9PEZI